MKCCILKLLWEKWSNFDQNFITFFGRNLLPRFPGPHGTVSCFFIWWISILAMSTCVKKVSFYPPQSVLVDFGLGYGKIDPSKKLTWPKSWQQNFTKFLRSSGKTLKDVSKLIRFLIINRQLLAINIKINIKFYKNKFIENTHF